MAEKLCQLKTHGSAGGGSTPTITYSRLRTVSGYSAQGATYTWSYTCPAGGIIMYSVSDGYGNSGSIKQNGTVKGSGVSYSGNFIVNKGDYIYLSHYYGSLSGYIDYYQITT